MITPILAYPLIGDDVVLNCYSFGMLKWSFKSRRYPLQTILLPDKNGSMIIKNITSSQSGTYTCYGEYRYKLNFIARTYIRVASEFLLVLK